MKAGTIDYQAWLIGAYVYTAVGVILSNSFGKGKNKSILLSLHLILNEKTKLRKQKRMRKDCSKNNSLLSNT